MKSHTLKNPAAQNKNSDHLSLSRILHGNCITLLRALPGESIDLVCTDPPYGIGFLGTAWDTFKPAQVSKKRLHNLTRKPRADGRKTPHLHVAADAGTYNHTINGNRAFQDFIADTGKELLRVMKPGAFLFMSMTPRQDSLSRAIAGLGDAGFNIGFTSLYWTFAVGFAKAMHVGRLVDRRSGSPRTVLGRNPNSRERCTKDNTLYRSGTVGKTDFITRGTSPLEGSYAGYHPKPAVEVIIVAMKPLSAKTYIDQALQNGKGVTWLADCRTPISQERGTGLNASGRFPANLLVSDAVLGEHSRFFSFDDAPRHLPFLIVPKASKREKNLGTESFPETLSAVLPLRAAAGRRAGRGADGSRTDRVVKTTNPHPTVKPLRLMQYLITLGSRPGDMVLDPFLGSGTTAMAAKSLGRRYIGIERERAYVGIARARVAATRPNKPSKG